MIVHRSRAVWAAIAVTVAGASAGCAGKHGASQEPATASSSRPTSAPPPSAQAQTRHEQTDVGPASGAGGSDDDAELVVSREIVQRCPVLRFVRSHANDLDPDMVWLAVLESVADCMAEGGPMSHDVIGVSGDEEHRHIVREVLSFKGVAGERVVARPVSAEGAAECQGGDCDKRVEITITTK